MGSLQRRCIGKLGSELNKKRQERTAYKKCKGVAKQKLASQPIGHWGMSSGTEHDKANGPMGNEEWHETWEKAKR